MDGVSATKRIIELRNGRNLPPIPVVALTAKISPEGKSKCLDAGMMDYINKPITRQKLVSILERLFPNKRTYVYCAN